MTKPTVETDPFLDTDFAPLDTRDRAQHIAELSNIAETHPDLQAGLVPEPPEPIVAAPAPPVVDEDQPEVFEVDGGTVTIVHDAKGWHGTLSLDDGGGDEVFHGKTQKELMTNVLAGKVKATAHIRKLNKKLKLGTPIEAPAPVPEVATVQPKQLDANDIFEIKTALENDPDKANDLRFQKKYGMTEAQFVQLVRKIEVAAKKGEEASEELTIEGVSKEFLESHKEEYYPYAENGEAIMKWLVKNKLRRPLTTQDNFGTISSELLRKGLYTVDNLEEAFEDLRDSGLLISPPKTEPLEEEPEEIETPPEPVSRVRPARQVTPVEENPRIVATRRQPRGGLGIRSSTIQNPTPEEPRAPSADELENMPTDQLRELLNQTYRHARSARR